MRWRSGLLTASSALLLAGCGGGPDRAAPAPKPPRIPAAVAARLAAEADRVAALPAGSCEARDAANRFRADVIASIGRIPTRYQEPLTSAANSLAGRLASCVTRTREARHEGKPKGHRRKHEKHDHGHGDDD